MWRARASTDPATGAPTEVWVPPRAPATWSPDEAVAVTGCDGTGASLACTRPPTNFTVSPGHARLLEAARVVAGEVLSMPEAIARGRETFGGLLEQRGTQEVAHADTDRG